MLRVLCFADLIAMSRSRHHDAHVMAVQMPRVILEATVLSASDMQPRLNNTFVFDSLCNAALVCSGCNIDWVGITAKQSWSILSYNHGIHLKGPRKGTKNFRYPTSETGIEIRTTKYRAGAVTDRRDVRFCEDVICLINI